MLHNSLFHFNQHTGSTWSNQNIGKNWRSNWNIWRNRRSNQNMVRNRGSNWNMERSNWNIERNWQATGRLG